MSNNESFNKYLLFMNLGPCTVLGTFANIMSSNLSIMILWDESYYHFTDEKLNLRDEICLCSNSRSVEELNSKPSTLSQIPYVSNTICEIIKC